MLAMTGTEDRRQIPDCLCPLCAVRVGGKDFSNTLRVVSPGAKCFSRSERHEQTVRQKRDEDVRFNARHALMIDRPDSQITFDVQGASVIALGKAKDGAPYSAAVYVVGVINGVWGVHRSDDGGATWTRFNDDAHQFGGIGVIAADQNL
jgi:hypothetical protein